LRVALWIGQDPALAQNKLTVVVTGAGGFVGGPLVAGLSADGRFAVRACFRALPEHPPRLAAAFEVGDIAEGNRWNQALAGADAVVHTAGRAHVMAETASDPLTAFRRVNVEGTMTLARAAVSAGVRRLIFLSSIKVNGEATSIDRPFTADDPPRPEDAYGISKREAEDGLRALSTETGLEVTILRLPLVYGPGVKGNLERLLRLVARSAPLPLGRVQNRRSLIGLDNLITAIAACLTNPAAANRTYLLSDQADLSTPDLVRLMATAMGRPARLLPMPVPLLRAAGALSGRGADVSRLAGSLLVDSSPISRELGWRPGVPPAEGIAAMVRAFVADP
jgi:nucleoside-diphosphate-sugar epimerase